MINSWRIYFSNIWENYRTVLEFFLSFQKWVFQAFLSEFLQIFFFENAQGLLRFFNELLPGLCQIFLPEFLQEFFREFLQEFVISFLEELLQRLVQKFLLILTQEFFLGLLKKRKDTTHCFQLEAVHCTVYRQNISLTLDNGQRIRHPEIFTW